MTTLRLVRQLWLVLLALQPVSGRRLQLPNVLPDDVANEVEAVEGSLPQQGGQDINITEIDTSGGTLSPEVIAQGEEALAQQLSSSDDPVEEYGDFYIPASYEATDDAGQPNCGLAMNASSTRCNRLIAKSRNLTCDCYNFCGGKLSGCYKYGESPSTLGDCEFQDRVLGCRVNFTPPVYNQTGPEPCPEGFMCNRDSEQLCDAIRAIPLAAGLGDVHAGLFCP